jgi:hypothetical protein
MKRLSILVLLILMVQGISAQDKENVEEKKFGIEFSGFVKNDFFWDSRQTVSAREGHFLLWPAAQNPDVNNVDINAQPSFNFLAIQSRLSGKITGPDALGAKTSGLIEGDFFAQSNANINLFRLRHAFIKLNWKSTELLTGQYWNPLFVTACFPGTVSFNTGTPMQSFARNPQIRVTQKIGDKLSIIVAALAQRDYTSRGPDPNDNTKILISSQFLRNSSIPDMHLQLLYSNFNESGKGLALGTGAAYKVITPRLYSVMGANKYTVDESVAGLTAIIFAKAVAGPVTVKSQLRYGENTADVLSPSGFAVVHSDPVTGEQTYTPLRNLTAWGEVHTNGKKVQVGVFGGYLKNLGTAEPMEFTDNSVYGLTTNISSLLRVSPRVILIANKFKFGCELEYTSVVYGNGFDVNYLPSTITTVANTRLLLSTIYSF